MRKVDTRLVVFIIVSMVLLKRSYFHSRERLQLPHKNTESHTENNVVNQTIPRYFGQSYENAVKFDDVRSATMDQARSGLSQINSCSVKICSHVQRVDRLRDECKRLSKWSNRTFRENNDITKRLLVDDKHKMLFCVYPGAASFSIMSMLYLGQTGQRPEGVLTYDDLQESGVSLLASLPADEQDKRLNDYTKILVTRHPFERLLSVWHGKFSDSNSTCFDQELTDKINAHHGKFDAHNGTTFRDFIDYIIQTSTREPGSTPDHWNTCTNLCHPCHITYNEILKLETLAADSRGTVARMQMNKMHHRNDRLHSEELLMQHTTKEYKGISNRSMHQLLEIYRPDMTLFGYHWNPDKLVSSCGTGQCGPHAPCC